MLSDTCSFWGFSDQQGGSQKRKRLLQCFSLWHDKRVRLNRYYLCTPNGLGRSAAYSKFGGRRFSLSFQAGVSTSEGLITYLPQRLLCVSINLYGKSLKLICWNYTLKYFWISLIIFTIATSTLINEVNPEGTPSPQGLAEQSDFQIHFLYLVSLSQIIKLQNNLSWALSALMAFLGH